jgi:hypothetical protein
LVTSFLLRLKHYQHPVPSAKRMHLQRPNYPKIIAKSQALSCRLHPFAKQARCRAARGFWRAARQRRAQEKTRLQSGESLEDLTRLHARLLCSRAAVFWPRRTL